MMLNIIACFCILTMIGIANLIGIKVLLYLNGDETKGFNPQTLCNNPAFRIYRTFPLVVCAFFYMIWNSIRRHVFRKRRPLITPYDKFIFNLQKQKLTVLKNSINFFVVSSLLLIFFDLGSSIVHFGSATSCNLLYFNKK